MLNKEFGGTVMKKDIREDGQFNITVETSSAIFRLVLKRKFENLWWAKIA